MLPNESTVTKLAEIAITQEFRSVRFNKNSDALVLSSASPVGQESPKIIQHLCCKLQPLLGAKRMQWNRVGGSYAAGVQHLLLQNTFNSERGHKVPKLQASQVCLSITSWGCFLLKPCRGRGVPIPGCWWEERAFRQARAQYEASPCLGGRLLSVGPSSQDLLWGYKTESCFTDRPGIEYPWDKGE